MSKYEVQTFSSRYGWRNRWHMFNALGYAEPETFDTKQDAATALDEFLEASQNNPKNGYRIKKYRIAKTRNPTPRG